MSTENLIRLRDKIQEDEALKVSIIEKVGQDPEAASLYLKEQGFELSSEELDMLVKKVAETDLLSDEQLDQVSGGANEDPSKGIEGALNPDKW